MSEPTRHKKAYYGWVPDLPDTRDHLYAAPAPTLADPKDRIDLYKQLTRLSQRQGGLP